MIARIAKIFALFIAVISVAGISGYLTLAFIIKSEDTVVTPKLIGKETVYALEILTDIGLNTKVKGFEYSFEVPVNHIIFQEPEAGSEIKKGRDVRIIISKGAVTVLTPNLKGLSIQQAHIIIEENGLHQCVLSADWDRKVEKDNVITHFPPSGLLIRRDSCINILVSLGRRPKAYKMPNLNGLYLDDAIILLERNNLSLGKIKPIFDKNKPQNIIISQEPLSGWRALEKTLINVTVNKKPNEKDNKYFSNLKGAGIFRYRLKDGFLKKHIKVKLNCFGLSNNLFNDFVKPGEEIWFLIPNSNATVLVYEDNKLVKTQIFD